MSQPPEGEIDCPHCHATPKTQDIRIIAATRDGRAVSIRHTKDCVDYPTEPERPGEEPTT